MIIQLNKGMIKIKPMAVPEQLHNLYIQYEYETGTEHLLPKMTIGTDVFMGDRKFINTNEGYESKMIHMVVELLDGDKKTIRKYAGDLLYSKYCIVDDKPIRPDIEAYLYSLESEIERLNKYIKELQEVGEVI